MTVVDTAGERSGAGTVEQRGFELGRTRAADADVVVHVVGPHDPMPTPTPKLVLVASKSDLRWNPPTPALRTSAVSGEGIDALRRRIIEQVGLADDVEAGSAVLLTERQRAAAASARARFEAAHACVVAGAPLEIVALEARAGADVLATLEGDRVGEAVLDQLFARFCIGK